MPLQRLSKEEIISITGLTPKFEIGEMVYTHDQKQRHPDGPFKILAYDTCCSQRHDHEHICYFLEKQNPFDFSEGEDYLFRTIEECEASLQHWAEFRAKYWKPKQ